MLPSAKWSKKGQLVKRFERELSPSFKPLFFQQTPFGLPLGRPSGCFTIHFDSQPSHRKPSHTSAAFVAVSAAFGRPEIHELQHAVGGGGLVGDGLLEAEGQLRQRPIPQSWSLFSTPQKPSQLGCPNRQKMPQLPKPVWTG